MSSFSFTTAKMALDSDKIVSLSSSERSVGSGLAIKVSSLGSFGKLNLQAKVPL
jgi:hypothetical protein